MKTINLDGWIVQYDQKTLIAEKGKAHYVNYDAQLFEPPTLWERLSRFFKKG